MSLRELIRQKIEKNKNDEKIVKILNEILKEI